MPFSIPPPAPEKVVIKRWYTDDKVLNYVEAEEYHLNEAAKLAGSWAEMSKKNKQNYHIMQALANRDAQKYEYYTKYYIPF